MNPQQPQSAPSPTPATPGPHHDPSRDELIELGMLAIEDANLAEAKANGISAADANPLGSPEPVATPVAPGRAPQPEPAAAPPAQPVPAEQPAVPVTVAPEAPAPPMAEGDVLAASPATVVSPTTMPPATPAPQAPALSQQDAWDKAAAAALPVPAPAAPAKQPGIPSVSPVDIMEYSANSSQLKSISRLRRVSVLLYVVIVGLAIAILSGGWYIYNKLGTNF